VASLKVIHARNPSFLGTQYTKIKSARKICTRTVLGTTKTTLEPDQIIQLYGRRWQIEGYFKVAKQYLRFDQTQVQSYDGLCGHMAMVMMSYDILALHQREQVDERTLGDIFYQLDTLLPIIDLATAIGQLLGELTNLKVTKSPAKMTAQIKTLIDQFLNGLSIQTSALITLSMSNS
jgi:hypothetical protein